MLVRAVTLARGVSTVVAGTTPTVPGMPPSEPPNPRGRADAGVAARGRTFLRRRGPDVLPPLAAMLASLGFLWWRSGYGIDKIFRPSAWGRWDTGHYLNIASHGYSAFWHCGGHSLPPHLPPGDYLCGTIGWFPGYPMLVRAVSWLPVISVSVAALLVAWASWYLMLFVMWQLLAGSRSPAVRWICLAAAAFVPGQVYFTALFPISLCLAAVLACLYFSLRSNVRQAPLYAFISGGLASYSYLTATAMAPALLITAVTVVVGRRRRAALFGAVGAIAGFGAVLLQMQLSVGIWDAYFISVKKYGVGTHNPLQTLGDRLKPAFTTVPAGRHFLQTEAVQTLLTLIIVGLVTAVTLTRFALARRRVVKGDNGRYWLGPVSRFLAARISGFDLCIVLLTIGVWLIPYIAGGSASTYRSEAFVLVAIPLLRRLPAPVLIPLLVAEIWVAGQMIPLFVQSVLV